MHIYLQLFEVTQRGRHFHRWVLSGLRTVKYHGANRETDVEKLCDADIIITTYHTLASDTASGKDPLHGMEWYRVVLDEGTMVTSLQSRLFLIKQRTSYGDRQLLYIVL